jgi:hypothetical protein
MQAAALELGMTLAKAKWTSAPDAIALRADIAFAGAREGLLIFPDLPATSLPASRKSV